jgi:CHAT domain-containing protein
MGLLYQKVGKYSRAESLFLRALEIQEALLPKDNFYSASTLHHLGMLYADKNQWGDALHHADRGRRSLTRQATSILPSLAESEQRTFLRNIIQSTLQKSLSLGFVRANDSNVADFSGAWLVNHKGLSFQTLAEQHRLSSEAKNPKVRGLVDQLQQTRAFLSRLLQQFPQPGLEQAHQEQRQKLYQKERDLAQQLARTVGRPFRENPWVEIQEIRGKLGTQTVLIDLVRFPVWDFKNRRWQPARYLAWITPPAGKGSVQIIDLGEAEPIDQGVEAARKALSKSLEEIRRQGEAEAVKQLREPMQTLARKTLYPLLEQLKDYPKWIICPDGALWLVPWSALPLPDGQYVVEQHSIRHVVSGRDLVIEYPKTQTVTPWLFADPDFDLTPAQVGTAANGVFRNLGPPEGLRLAGRRLLGRIGNWRIAFAFQENGQVLICDEDDNGKVIGQGPWQLNGNTLTMTSENYHYLGTVQGALVSGQRTGTLGTDPWEIRLAGGDLEMVQLRSAGTASGILAKVNRLPFTAAEAEAVRPLVKAWTTMEPKVVMGEEAGEAVIKAVRRPRLLMLSTHGYFLPEQEVKLPDRLSGLVLDEQRPRVVLDVHGKPLENPLLRCGLLLAGCNQRQQVQGDEDDGLLTGMEIVGLDLRGCELVVLSACETGLGDVRTGEGVAGLRQAFQLAGASAVVATLWSIPDRDSARLMSDFFGNLAKGQSKAAALREAQLARIKAHRERTGAAHPFFWAAFTLTGQ